MAVADHIVSYRNGSQIMVRGLALAERLGYCRDARVQITDPTGAGREPWVFTVPNDEYATLSCQTPPPPEWIQPGVAIRIEVETPLEAADALLPVAAQAIPVATTMEPDVNLAAVTSSAGLRPHVVYAIDVGSPSGGLAWARLAPQDESGLRGSMNFAHFLHCLVEDLRSSLPVSLGFEAPLFVPVVQSFQDLSRARTQEPSAWSFGAGAYVTAVAVPLMSYVLRHIHEQLNPAPRVTLDPAEWMPRGASSPQLHVWEAFVWGPGHARAVNRAGLEPHVQDAATAALAFVHWEGMEPRRNSDITASHPFSTVGAAVLWSGLSTDIRLLHKDVLVLRPLQVLGTGVLPYKPPTGI